MEKSWAVELEITWQNGKIGGKKMEVEASSREEAEGKAERNAFDELPCELAWGCRAKATSCIQIS